MGLNGVCTQIMHMDLRKLKVYGGNYDQFMKTRAEQVEAQMKQYNWEQDQIAHMKEYIARFGHGSAKLARQAQSKEKTLAKMVADGLTQKVVADRRVSFCFYDCGKIPPPVIMVQNVSFRYNEETPWIYKNLEFGMDLDTRLALVGPNGAGKSTLIKLIYGSEVPTEGMVRRHNHLKLGLYHQHLHELLEMDLSPLDYMMKKFPEFKERDEMRKVIGRCDQELRGWSYTRQSRLPAHRPSGKRHLDLREPKGDEVGRRHSCLQEPPQGQGYESGQQGRQIERPGQGCQRRLVEFQKNALQSLDKLEETEQYWTLGPTIKSSRQCSCLCSMFSRPPKVDQSIFTLVSTDSL